MGKKIQSNKIVKSRNSKCQTRPQKMQEKKGKKESYPLSCTTLGIRSLTRSLQSTPFPSPGGGTLSGTYTGGGAGQDNTFSF